MIKTMARPCPARVVDVRRLRWKPSERAAVVRASYLVAPLPALVKGVLVLRIDDLLEELGLDELPEKFVVELKAQLIFELDMRVGTRLAARLDDDQLTEFEAARSTDERLAAAWLDRFLPDHSDVVRDEVARLKTDLEARVDEIVSAAEESASQDLTSDDLVPNQEVEEK